MNCAEMVGTMEPSAACQRLSKELTAVGLPYERDVLVHCSLRAIGRAAGGPTTLLAAIRDAIGPRATVVAPAHTANNSTTSPDFRAITAGMDQQQLHEFEAAMPGFDHRHTPSWRMGAFAEYVRTFPGAVRSAHPQTSFVALGRSAVQLMAVHTLECHLGEDSPLAALYAVNAWIALIGVGYDRCTALHLAEHRLPWPAPTRLYRCYVRSESGERMRQDFIGVDLDASDFTRLGQHLASQPWARTGRVGGTTATVLPLVLAVDFAVDWMTRNRRP